MRFLSLCLLLLTPMVATAGIGVFADVQGDTRIQRGEVYLAAAPGVDVEEDDILDTGDNASAQVEMQDGSMLKLGAASRLLLADYKFDSGGNVVSAGQEVLFYDRWAGHSVSYAYLACYPTTAANVRADYTLPGDVVVPRMQRGAEAPILPSSPAKLPVLLYSHGYGGSPLDGNYLSALVAFASWGYVTLAPFHGDLRYSVFGPDALSARFSIPVWDEFVAMQAIRPLSMSAGLDLMLARTDWRDRIDAGRIGAFGVSQGGETVALLAGAKLTYALFGFDSKRVTQDSRGRAGVGYVPYSGLDNVPAFGRDQDGARGLTMPFLALSGTEDHIAPQGMVRKAIDRMEAPRGHVLFSGQGHELDPSSGADILTWSLGFLDAWLNGNAAAQSRLLQVVSVEGGLDDHKEIYVDPTGGGGGGAGEVVETVEYYNPSLDHYFITAFPTSSRAACGRRFWPASTSRRSWYRPEKDKYK